jgi:hypothetical protein
MMCSRLRHGGVKRGGLRAVIGGAKRCMLREEGAGTQKMRKREDSEGGRMVIRCWLTLRLG